MIWSKEINESNYSSIRTLQPFNQGGVTDLIFILNDEFNFLISCCHDENKIVIYKEEEELEHEYVKSLIPISNGIFASGGGWNKCLNIWSPSS